MHNACMSHKMKFHLIAVVLIVLIVSIVHSMMKPEALAPRIVTVVQYNPIIVDATWGRNCNPRIQQALAQMPAGPRPIMPDEATASGRPSLVSHNNVLDKVKELCANTDVCSFKANDQTLGPILSGCQAQLEIRYYCTEAERVRSTTATYNRDVKLDCSRVRR